MMEIIKNVLGVVLGFGASSSLPNKVAGATNYAIFLPVLTWVWFHKAGELTLQIVVSYSDKSETIKLFNTTFGGLGVIIIGALVYLEFLRRSGPGARANP